MYCLNCGKEIQENAKFCVYCGTKVTNSKLTESKQTGPKFVAGICPNCGSHLSIDASLEKAFCQYCGTEFLVAKDPETNTFGDINVNISSSSSTDESIKINSIDGNGNIVNVSKKNPVNEYEYLKVQEERKATETIEQEKTKQAQEKSSIIAIIMGVILVIILYLFAIFLRIVAKCVKVPFHVHRPRGI